jgi:hypothetical protein
MEGRLRVSVKPHSIARYDSVRERLMPERQWRSEGAVAYGQDRFEKPALKRMG